MSDRLYITEAVDLGGLKVRLVFSDGTDSTVEVGDYIRCHPYPQYNKTLKSSAHSHSTTATSSGVTTGT